MHHPTDRIAHTTAFVTPVMEHWLEREIAQWVHHEGSIQRPIVQLFSCLQNVHRQGKEYTCFFFFCFFLFNDTLNTFYLQLYVLRHMVKDHSDSEKGNPLLPHRLLLSINSTGSFICTIPDRITHTTAFVTPVVEHWLEREIAKNIKQHASSKHSRSY